MMLDLTIVIPVKNEEQNLLGCLTAIGTDLATKVIVIDSGSADNTKDIAVAFGAEVISFKWNGRFPKKRNWFLKNYMPATKWVLFLDADEYLTEAFKSELRQKLKNENKAGYWLSYSTYFLGKKLKGGYPLRKLALFQVGAGEYESVNEEHWSELDMEVHEHSIINGEVGVIKSKIDHKDNRGVSNFVIKHNEYASWEAARCLKAIKEGNSAHWSWNQQLKYRLMISSLFPPLFFFGTFFLYGGFRDGARGFAHAVLRMSYYMQTYCKIREIINASNFQQSPSIGTVKMQEAQLKEISVN